MDSCSTTSWGGEFKTAIAEFPEVSGMGSAIARVSRNGLAVIHAALLAHPAVCAAAKEFSTRSARIHHGAVLDVITKDK